jgi:hypothetical protein
VELLPLLSRLVVVVASFGVGVYVLFRDRRPPSNVVLAAGLLLLGADSAFFTFHALFMIETGRPPEQYAAAMNAASTASSILTVVHWALISCGVILMARAKPRVRR